MAYKEANEILVTFIWISKFNAQNNMKIKEKWVLQMERLFTLVLQRVKQERRIGMLQEMG